MDHGVIFFLKLKTNEIHAVGDLFDNDKERVCIFFDYARRAIDRDKNGSLKHSLMDEYLIESIPKTVKAFSKKMKKYTPFLNDIYLDDYDINEDVEINGKHAYYSMMVGFETFKLIPVIGIDRDSKRIEAVRDLLKDRIVKNDVVCLRVNLNDFLELGPYIDEIVESLGDLIDEFDHVDLVLDCRVLGDQNLDHIESQGNLFAKSIQSRFNLRRTIISGSAISTSAASIIPTNQHTTVLRKEIELYRRFFDAGDSSAALLLGDYGVVSPDYADIDGIDPRQYQTRTAAKLIYPYSKYFYFERAGSIKINGSVQFRTMFASLLSQPFFRGMDFSVGDYAIAERASGSGPNVTPSTAVRIYVNAHITYMLNRDWFNG